jgi:hypothetical protein
VEVVESFVGDHISDKEWTNVVSSKPIGTAGLSERSGPKGFLGINPETRPIEYLEESVHSIRGDNDVIPKDSDATYITTNGRYTRKRKSVKNRAL